MKQSTFGHSILTALTAVTSLSSSAMDTKMDLNFSGLSAGSKRVREEKSEREMDEDHSGKRQKKDPHSKEILALVDEHQKEKSLLSIDEMEALVFLEKKLIVKEEGLNTSNPDFNLGSLNAEERKYEDVSEELKNRLVMETSARQFRGQIHNHSGHVYYGKMQYLEAIEEFKKALEIEEWKGGVRALTLKYIAHSYFCIEQYQEAFTEYSEVLKIREAENTRHQVLTYMENCIERIRSISQPEAALITQGMIMAIQDPKESVLRVISSTLPTNRFSTPAERIGQMPETTWTWHHHTLTSPPPPSYATVPSRNRVPLFNKTLPHRPDRNQ